MFTELTALILGLAATFLSMPVIIQKMRRKRIVGVDVHKKDRTLVP